MCQEGCALLVQRRAGRASVQQIFVDAAQHALLQTIAIELAVVEVVPLTRLTFCAARRRCSCCVRCVKQTSRMSCPPVVSQLLSNWSVSAVGGLVEQPNFVLSTVLVIDGKGLSLMVVYYQILNSPVSLSLSLSLSLLGVYNSEINGSLAKRGLAQGLLSSLIGS